MKFYVLKHPEKGYLSSSKYFYCSWTDDLQRAKKWSFKSHPKSLMKQTTRPFLKECEVVEIEVFGYSIMDSEKLVIVENRSKYADL